jgi:CheY-like chemotaxis protein
VDTVVNIRKIMIVDDEEDIREICAVSVREVGKLEVVVASSGQEALERGNAEKPDVILLDVMMPRMDGIETLRKLREQDATARLPVIFFTAKVQEQEIKRYLALGAAGVITKPFDPMKLPDEIRRLVREFEPSGQTDEDADRELSEIRKAFRKRLPDRVDHLARALAEAQRTGASEVELRQASLVAHTLQGTAGSYGYRDIGAEIRLIEEQLHRLIDGGRGDRQEAWLEIESALSRVRSWLGRGQVPL